MDINAILASYGPLGLLVLFILHVLQKFECFVTDAEARCEERYKDLFAAYQELASDIKEVLKRG